MESIIFQFFIQMYLLWELLFKLNIMGCIKPFFNNRTLKVAIGSIIYTYICHKNRNKSKCEIKIALASHRIHVGYIYLHVFV